MTRLERAGYAIIADVLRQREIELLRNSFATASAAGGTEHVRIDRVVPDREAWQALALNPVIAAAAAQILGGPAQVSAIHAPTTMAPHGSFPGLTC